MENASRQPAQRWPQAITLVIGIWVFLSPWVFGFYALSALAAWNYWILGAVAIVFSILALTIEPMEWINILAGAWLVASPWVVGYSPLPGATSDAVVTGALLVAFAIFALYGSTPNRLGPA